jgi:predicted PurR-regulated permease PerM
LKNHPLEAAAVAERLQAQVQKVSYLTAAVLLAGTLMLHLVPALFAGMLTYLLIQTLAPKVPRTSGPRGKLVVVGLIAFAVVAIIIGLAVMVALFLRTEGGLSMLFEHMARILSDASSTLPSSIADYLPKSAAATRTAVIAWLQEHSAEMKVVGKEAGVAFAQVLIGMIIGAMVAFREAASIGDHKPLAAALLERAHQVADAFRRVVFAQLRISLINTGFTATYLFAVLPLFGVHLPLRKTMIVLTFVVGMLPVVGNLISNTVIVVVSFSQSLWIAAASLAFLVTIHKLEYFLNARIVGGHIHARSWELLLAMLVMEALFGLPGLAAAPVFYAYLKSELARLELV